MLTGLVLCRGVVLLCVFAPFEGWDEYQHVAYIVRLSENGSRPWLGQADVPASLLARLPEFPHCNSALRQIGSVGAVDFKTFWELQGRGTAPVAVAPTPGGIRLYQAQHGPLYYRLVRPLFERLGGVGNLRRSVGGLRLVNLLLTAGSVWVALGIVAQFVRDRRLAAFCGLLIATQPLFLINGVRVANDALGVFLATIAVGWALNPSRRYPLLGSVGLGIVAGTAVLAKSVNLGLIPFIAVCWLMETVRGRRGHGEALARVLALSCGFLLMTQSEFRANWSRFGTLTVMQEAVLNRQEGHGLGDLLRTAGSISWVEFLRNLWLRKNLMSGGWSWAGHNERYPFRHEVLVLASLLGWVFLVSRSRRARIAELFRDPAIAWLSLAVCSSYSVSLAYHVMQSKLCWGAMSTNPWYAAAAYPMFLLLVAGGGFAWPIGRFRHVLPALLVLLFLETEASTVLGSMVARYTMLVDWPKALHRLAFLQPPFYGTATLYGAIAGVLVFAGMAIAACLRIAFEPSTNQPVPPSPHMASLTCQSRSPAATSSDWGELTTGFSLTK